MLYSSWFWGGGWEGMEAYYDVCFNFDGHNGVFVYAVFGRYVWFSVGKDFIVELAPLLPGLVFWGDAAHVIAHISCGSIHGLFLPQVY